MNTKFFALNVLLTSSLLPTLSFGDVDQQSGDLTVLQSWLSDKRAAISFDTPWFKPDYPLDPTRCRDIRREEGASNEGSYTSVTGDCSAELSRIVSQEFNQASPLITDAVFEYVYRDQNRSYSNTGLCEIIEFRTVIRDAALYSSQFTGIGFYYRQGTDNSASQGKFVPKSSLHVVGHVKLKDGAAATVHRFIARGMCFGLGGNGGSVAYRRYTFRPFAQFMGDTQLYNNWDATARDYVLGRASDGTMVQTFDRQLELLAP